MIHVNKKTIKEAIILFPFFLLHYLSLFKNSPMLLLFYYSLCWKRYNSVWMISKYIWLMSSFRKYAFTGSISWFLMYLTLSYGHSRDEALKKPLIFVNTQHVNPCSKNAYYCLSIHSVTQTIKQSNTLKHSSIQIIKQILKCLSMPTNDRQYLKMLVNACPMLINVGKSLKNFAHVY